MNEVTNIINEVKMLSLSEQCELHKELTILLMNNEYQVASMMAESLWLRFRFAIFKKEPDVEIEGGSDFRSAEWRGLVFVFLKDNVKGVTTDVLQKLSGLHRTTVTKAIALYRERLGYNHPAWNELKDMYQFLIDKYIECTTINETE